MEQFPEIPRSLVVKADAIREGVKPNAASRQIGRWVLPDAHWYFEYDREDSHTAEETAEGYTLSPVMCHFPNGVSFHVMFDSRSPYEFRYEERGRYRLLRDGEPIEEVFFTPRPQWYDRKTSSGRPMPSVMALRSEESLFIAALNYCEYFKDNQGCKYCNIVSSESVKTGLGMERVMAKRDQDIYETFVAAAQEGKIGNVGMSGGVILDTGREAENYARIARVLRQAMKDVGQEAPITVICQAMEVEHQLKLKEAGVSSWKFNMEVWDPRLFEIICPGKARHVGRQRWIDRMLQVVEILGRTNTSFVLGVEMAQPYGFKTEDEAAESVLEGWEWLMPRGIMPSGTLWRPVPGTEFAGVPSPRTEYWLRMSLAHYKLAVQHNLAPKPGRPPAAPGQAIYGDFPHVALPDSLVAGKAPAAGPSAEVC
ncbi:MAG: hypothetical protein Q7R39_19205 [Dehalococcoidia bacterium]|nr:hypothetical protein [Dehalococcoidia bacterium]